MLDQLIARLKDAEQNGRLSRAGLMAVRSNQVGGDLPTEVIAISLMGIAFDIIREMFPGKYRWLADYSVSRAVSTLDSSVVFAQALGPGDADVNPNIDVIHRTKMLPEEANWDLIKLGFPLWLPAGGMTSSSTPKSNHTGNVWDYMVHAEHVIGLPRHQQNIGWPIVAMPGQIGVDEMIERLRIGWGKGATPWQV